MIELSVVLPAYNEDENIETLVNRWQKYQGMLSNDYGMALRIFVINDGSVDQTREVAERLENSYSNLTLINHLQNKGLGEAIKTGITHVLKNCPNSSHLCLMDCDNTQGPQYILDMLDVQCKSGCDVIIASRYQKGAQVIGVSRFRLFTSEGARYFFSMILRVPSVRDYTCGFRLYTRQILLQAFDRFGVNLIEERGFTCMAELLYKLYCCGAVFAEIPFELRYNFKRGASKMAVFKTAVNSFRLALRLRRIKKYSNGVPL
ncbi:MAG TPA: glycosyltransferase family 2 protein [Desulfosporosinus sp.]|nr:glycosyltransferase family 2 protein [Desulfosporosinus sp.]